MSFKESIIIPLEIYQRCHLQTKTKDFNILLDKSLPTDEKMKLFSQAQLEKKRKKRKNLFSSKAEFAEISLLGNNILQLIPRQDKPIIKAILEIIKQNPSQISWNNNNEVILDGKTLINSNITEMFLYMRKHLTVTKNKDIPMGIVPFYRKLLSLNIAPEWIKQKPPRISLRVKSKSSSEKAYEEEQEQYLQKTFDKADDIADEYHTTEELTPSSKAKRQKKKRRKQAEELNESYQAKDSELSEDLKTPKKSSPQKRRSAQKAAQKQGSSSWQRY